MTPSKGLSAASGRGVRVALWAAGLAALAGLAYLWAWYWPGALPLDHVSGIWTALASDLAHGVFYRPIFDGWSYGGTRYMPLFFLLHGLLIALSQAPAAAGVALSLGSMALLLIGFYRLLRLAGLRPAEAAPLAALPAASINFLLLTLEIKGDFLASALNVWGLVFLFKYERDRRPAWPAAAGLCFAGAFLTKLSTLYGLAAGLAYYWISGRFRESARLAVPALLFMGLGLAAVHLGSGGRALEAFLACADGGMDPGFAARFPVWFFRAAGQDPFFLILSGAALFHFIRSTGTKMKNLPELYFALTAAATLFLFATPGADGNHLLDLVFASVLIIGLNLDKNWPARLTNLAVLTVTALLVVWTFIPGLPSIRHYLNRTGRPTVEAAAFIRDRLTQGTASLLSETPLLPVLYGERPIVLDAFQLRLIARRNPDIETDFNRRLENRDFGAVVLLDWSGAPPERLEQVMDRHFSAVGRPFYGKVHFFPGFLERLRKHYFLSFTQGPFVVYEPRQEKDFVRTQEARGP